MKGLKNRKLRGVILSVILALSVLYATPVLAQQRMNISFGGSTPGGMMYYLVGVAGTIISRDLPQYNITQVSTGGSTENCKRLIKGELDMGIVYGPHVYMALRQEGPFKGGPKGNMLRGVTKIYEGSTYFVTLPDAGIKKMSDLAGKSVALGPPGSGTVFNSTNVLRALGLLEKVKGRQMSFADAGRAVANKQIDAFAQSSAPAGSVKELAETKGAYVIPFSDEEITKITKMYPYYYGGVMKAGTYKGVPPTQMPYLPVYWVAHERVPAKAIQDILELVYKPEIKKQLVEGNKGWAQMDPGIKYFLGLGAPMHAGAEAYFKSKGLWPK
jgi:TRAP transporter TAXI family solute receptor